MASFEGLPALGGCISSRGGGGQGVSAGLLSAVIHDSQIWAELHHR